MLRDLDSLNGCFVKVVEPLGGDGATPRYTVCLEEDRGDGFTRGTRIKVRRDNLAPRPQSDAHARTFAGARRWV